MATLLRAPVWRRCLQEAPAGQHRQICGSAWALWAGKPLEDIQDPSKVHPAYDAGGGEPGGRRVPGPDDDGVEREVKWGKNIPASAEQAKEELKYAGKGLAESVQQGVGVLVNKAKDAASAAARSVGLDSGRGPEMSSNSALHDHGAAGKMEHAPPGESGWNRSAGVDRKLAREKYDEISSTEKPNYPEGERTVNELFPDMTRAAGEQSNTIERQREENERIRREMHKGSS